jgi:carbonic anhydrase
VTTHGHAAPAYTAAEALARLKNGNARFLSGEARFPNLPREVLADLAKGQQPYATILGCSDSRVPPELVFDAGFGELFIVRVTGNVDPTLSPEAMLTANVRWTIRELVESPEGKARTAEGVMKLVGAVYELTTGRVRFIE